MGSMVSGSTYSVQSLFVNVARESHKLVLDLLKDFQASVRYRNCMRASFKGTGPYICDIKTLRDVSKKHVLDEEKWNRVLKLWKFIL